MIAYRTGQLEEAKSEFRRATELDEAQHVAWTNLATIYFNEHDYEAAEQAALHGLEKSPNVPKLHFLAGAAQLAGKRSTKETIMHLEQAAQAFPSAREILMKLRQ